MKHLLKFTAFALLSGVLFYISCKKENSCENCGVNPPGSTNKPPIAIAGPDQVITLPTDSVLLDGRQSSDPDGTISSYLWTKISGPVSITINNPGSALTLAKNIQGGYYWFELKVTDNGGLSAKDTILITVNDQSQPNHPPIANAGTNQTITLPSNTVTLNGSASTDQDYNITGYAWTKISGPSSFNITNPNTVQTQVANLVQGVYQFELKVTDAGTLFSKDTMQVTVNPPPPACNPGNRPLVSAQLIPIGTLSQTRGGTAVATAGDKILFAGGSNNSPGSSRVDIYNVTTNTWSTAELSQGRSGIGVAVLGNKVFFAGGRIEIPFNGQWGDNGTRSSRIDIYDASNNSWSTAELSEARCPIGVVAGNKVVFAGGDAMFNASAKVDLYDASTNLWSTAMLSAGRQITSATAIGNKIFFAGGVNYDYLSAAIDIYDASSNSWTVSSFSQPLAPCGIAVGTKNYWAGGHTEDIYGGGYATNSVEVKDENSGISSYTCLFEPNAYFDAVLKSNKIIFFTGCCWSAESNKFDIYDIATSTWSIGVLNQNITNASIISVNNTIYVGGGVSNGVLSNQVWKLEF